MNAEQQCTGGAAIDHDETGVCNHGTAPEAPAVGDRYVKRAEPDAGRIVTVSRVWAAGDDGHTAVAYDWGDRGQCGSACPLGVFLGTYEPYTEAAEVGDALLRVLHSLRDALADPRPTDKAEALADARELLADHARALATLVYDDVRADRERNPGGGNNGRNHIRRGGMMSAQLTLDRYADDLAAAVDGGQ